MKPRTLIVVLILLAVLLLGALNWETFTTPAELNVVLGQVRIALGLLLIAVVAGLSILYVIFLARIEVSAWMESRQDKKELDKVRTLAASSEESRLQKLREFLDVELRALHAKLDALTERIEKREVAETVQQESREVQQRIARAEQEIKDEIRRADATPG